MKLFKIFFLVTLFSLPILNSCEEDEVEITGDSELLIINESSMEYGVYFDSKFLGDVDSEKNRRWSVPSGEHSLKCKCRGLGNDLSDTYYFGQNQTVLLRIYEEKSADIPSVFIVEN